MEPTFIQGHARNSVHTGVIHRWEESVARRFQGKGHPTGLLVSELWPMHASNAVPAITVFQVEGFWICVPWGQRYRGAGAICHADGKESWMGLYPLEGRQ